MVLDGRYWVRPDFIYYESRFKSARWRTEITGLETGPLRVRIDPNYTARLVFPGETIYSLIRLQLARRGLLLLHAPAVGRHGRSLLLPARGGTGKTITAVNFARRGWDFLGDDSCILAEDRAYSFVTPFNLRFTYDVERLLGVRFSTGKRAEIFLKKSLALATLRRITLFTRIPSQDVFGPQIIDSAPLGAVYLLIHGPRPAVSEPRPTDLFARQVFISTLFEADELRAMLLAYNYANPGSPLTRLWPEFESRLAQRLARAVCRQISVPQDYTPEVFEMIHDQAKRDLDPAAGEARP